MMMEKSKAILKNFWIAIYTNIFFLVVELISAYVENDSIKIILCINISCFIALSILTGVKLIRKDYELPMYSSLLLLGCSIAWVIPILLYGSIFGNDTRIVTGSLYGISIGIGILIPVLQGKVNKNKTFWIAIRKIGTVFSVCIVSVLIVLWRAFSGGHVRRMMHKPIPNSSIGKIMWGVSLVASMLFGGISVFCIIGNSQNPNSEFNQNRKNNNFSKYSMKLSGKRRY